MQYSFSHLSHNAACQSFIYTSCKQAKPFLFISFWRSSFPLPIAQAMESRKTNVLPQQAACKPWRYMEVISFGPFRTQRCWQATGPGGWSRMHRCCQCPAEPVLKAWGGVKAKSDIVRFLGLNHGKETTTRLPATN